MARRPIVVKLGSSTIVDGRGRLRRTRLDALAADIAAARADGEPVCVVSSGAIALGLGSLKRTTRPTRIAELQAAAAVGQGLLQQAWQQALGRHGVLAAQVLLTAAEVRQRTAYLNARGTLSALLQWGAVPVVNENDSTATDEITFGDNDALAAQVALLQKAKLLILLTDQDGLYTGTRATRGPNWSARCAITGCSPSSRSAARAPPGDLAACARRSSPPRWRAPAGPPP